MKLVEKIELKIEELAMERVKDKLKPHITALRGMAIGLTGTAAIDQLEQDLTKALFPGALLEVEAEFLKSLEPQKGDTIRKDILQKLFEEQAKQRPAAPTRVLPDTHPMPAWHGPYGSPYTPYPNLPGSPTVIC